VFAVICFCICTLMGGYEVSVKVSCIQFVVGNM